MNGAGSKRTGAATERVAQTRPRASPLRDFAGSLTSPRRDVRVGWLIRPCRYTSRRDGMKMKLKARSAKQRSRKISREPVA